MNTVKFIRERDGGRLSVGVITADGERVFNISSALYASMTFTRGTDLSDDELDRLAREDEEYRAMKKALSLLGYSDKNRKTLFLRLLREGFSREVVETVVERCMTSGYIRERDQLSRLILREANVNLRGPRYIRDKLAAKGYSRTDVDAVMDELTDAGEVDFEANLHRLCEKKGASTPDERRALAYKYGYRSV